MLELATDGRNSSFEYCANKQQVTEATSEICWIFLGLKTNYPTNKCCTQFLFSSVLFWWAVDHIIFFKLIYIN